MGEPGRRLLLLDLKDDAALIAAYERWHEPGAVPAAVVRSIRAAGIVGMEIFRCGTRLAMIVETSPAFDPAAKAAADLDDPDVVAWERLMDGFQQALPWSEPGTKWIEARRIFSLDEQP
ncbi:L-rhamnose mutarotase [Sphingomonas ginkgonis]|uniref:L-rhamnose mutarotase n=1 Tax=Sphingomonas ginkgonis TaxID=2315330 RepID=A0A429VCA8_9SPHN|nr:L-rhamnose mutarotase [Sphingomonas ginkgonis]RST31527.1 L-rhamnose mutarotase [Sphingomonas ginkgonis]